MELNKTLTATVYVINKGKVLLHMHKKYKSFFPLGGHMLSTEVPHETALREVFEESGLHIDLYNNEDQLELGRVVQLYAPIHILLENVGHDVENMDFIYFATTDEEKVLPQSGESKEIYWLTREELINNNDILPHIKSMALKALDTIK